MSRLVEYLFAFCFLLKCTCGTSLRIGAFNIKTFGEKKMSNPEVAETIAKVVSRYDVILIQEIRDSDLKSVYQLRDQVNSMTNAPYDFVVTKPLGRSTYREQYAYFFRTDTVQVLDKHVFDDVKAGDMFSREPFCLLLNISSQDPWQLALIGLHSAPKDAVNEIALLVEVEKEVKSKWKQVKNVLFMGDLNADCRYASDEKMADKQIIYDSSYHWWIDSNADTTTGKSICAYDRLIARGDRLVASKVSAGVFLFDKDMQMSEDLMSKVSDHYPVEVELSV